ncbi:YbfB/YjiJ family MFS transporter [Pseudazoarcus pumilus]|nr:YbfB/YjiJ family MFS transporter [Pseudazoarcus pumilus]
MNQDPDRKAVTAALAGMAALVVAMGIGRFAFTPLLPLMQAETGLSLAGGGWLAGANYLGYLVGALAATRIRAAPAGMLASGLVAVVLTTAAMAPTQGFAVWMTVRFAAGVASAWALVGAASLCLGRLREAGRPRLAGVMFSGVGLGIVLAGLACQAVVFAGGGAVAGWWVLAALAAVLAVPAVRGLSRGSGSPATQDMRPAAQGFDARDARRLVWSYGLLGFGYILPATFLPAQARVLVSDPAVFGWVWPVFGAAAAASMWIAVGPRRGGVSRRMRWAVSQAVMAVGVALPVVHDSLAALVVSALCVGGTFLVVTMLALQEGAAVGGERAQRLIAAMTAAFASGQLLGPLVAAGLELGGQGMAPALMLASAALAVGAVLPVMGRRDAMHATEESR